MVFPRRASKIARSTHGFGFEYGGLRYTRSPHSLRRPSVPPCGQGFLESFGRPLAVLMSREVRFEFLHAGLSLHSQA